MRPVHGFIIQTWPGVKDLFVDLVQRSSPQRQKNNRIFSACQTEMSINASHLLRRRRRRRKNVAICHSRMNEYQPRTFRPNSINSQRRLGLLPAYPSARTQAEKDAILLLSNVAQVDREKREKESFCGGHGIAAFELKQNRFMDPIDSFIVDLYRDLFVEPSRRWKIEGSIIDYNLCRLRRCMALYTAQTNEAALLSFDEWPMALEFYLQIDGRDRSSFVQLHFLTRI